MNFSDDVHNRGKPVAQGGEFHAMDFGGSDAPARTIRQVSRGATAGDDGAVITVIERGTGRGAHAHVRHETNHDEIVAPECPQGCVERCIGEGIGQQFLHDGFAVARDRRSDSAGSLRSLAELLAITPLAK